MVGNKLELQIIGLFNNDITLLLSINQIAKKLGKAYPYINAKVNELVEQGILNLTEVGRSHLCSINLKSEKAIILLSLNEVFKKERKLKNISQPIAGEINNIKSIFKVYTVVLSGKELIFVLDHIHDKEAIKNRYPNIKRFDLSFFTKKEFQEQVLEDSILKEHTIMYSPQDFFEILQEVQPQLMAEQLIR